MKFAAVIEYVQDREKVAALRPVHREYLASLYRRGRLVAAGPFTDDSGSLIVYQAESQEEADQLIRADPFAQNGIFVRYQMRPWNPVFANRELFPPPPPA